MFWVCVCGLIYPTCVAYSQYYCIVVCGLSGCTVFFDIISNGTIFERKKLFNIIFVFIFSKTFVWKISLSTKNSASYYKCTWLFMSSTCYSCKIVIRVVFPWHLKKYSNIKFRENPSSRSGIVPFEQMYRQSWRG